MKVLVDGKEIEVLNDVRFVYDAVTESGVEGSLVVVANHEGLVYDFYEDKMPDEPAGTGYDFVDDIVKRIAE
jgi:hypothetical protein